MLLVGAAILTAGLLITNWIEAFEKRNPKTDAQQVTPEVPLGREGAYRLVFASRYLLAIAFLSLIVNWVNTTGEYLLGRTVAETAKAAVANGMAGGLSVDAYIGKFYSDFFAVVNLVGMLMQLFLVSRILKYLGVWIAILVLPSIALLSYSLIATFSILAVVRWAKTAENATDYSLQSTVRNILFLPTTREEKYKAKQVVDTLFWRAGDVLSAGLVFIGTVLMTWAVSQFAIVCVLLGLIWFGLALWIGRENRRLVSGTESVPGQAALAPE